MFSCVRDQNLQRLGRWLCRQFQRLLDSIQWEAVGDDFQHREFLFEHQGGCRSLDVNGGAVAAQDFLFVNAHGRRGKFDLGYRVVCGEKQNTTAGPRRRQRFDYKRGMRDSYENGIGSPPFGSGLYCSYQLTIGWVEGLNGAKGEALGAALGDGIASEEVAGTQLADHQELQADGAAADDQDGLARGDAGFIDGFDDGVNGLDEGGFFEADIVGKRDHAALSDPGHGFYVLSEAAAVGSKAGGEAGGFVLLALGKEAFFAVEAFGAGRVVKAHDAVAGLPLGDAGACGHDSAG